jgi:hypothetical protein
MIWGATKLTPIYPSHQALSWRRSRDWLNKERDSNQQGVILWSVMKWYRMFQELCDEWQDLTLYALN